MEKAPGKHTGHVININMKYFIVNFCSKHLEMLGSAFTIIAITTYMQLFPRGLTQKMVLSCLNLIGKN